jgi:hypothetical protein
MPTKCPHCGKQYKTASTFSKHFIICHALANAEKKDEILNSLELTNLIREATKDIKVLKQKVKLLENRGVYKVGSVNIIDWMNKYMKDCKHFKHWIEEIVVDNKALKYVLDVGFNNGVVKIILNNCRGEWNHERIPIRCFNEMKGIYVFDSSQWRSITDTEFKEIICLIQRKLFVEYKTEEDKIDVYDPNKNDKYLEDMRILCGNGQLEKNTNIIKNKFYTEIKLSGRQLSGRVVTR